MSVFIGNSETWSLFCMEGLTDWAQAFLETNESEGNVLSNQSQFRKLAARFSLFGIRVSNKSINKQSLISQDQT